MESIRIVGLIVLQVISRLIEIEMIPSPPSILKPWPTFLGSKRYTWRKILERLNLFALTIRRDQITISNYVSDSSALDEMVTSHRI